MKPGAGRQRYSNPDCANSDSVTVHTHNTLQAETLKCFVDCVRKKSCLLNSQCQPIVLRTPRKNEGKELGSEQQHGEKLRKGLKQEKQFVV